MPALVHILSDEVVAYCICRRRFNDRKQALEVVGAHLRKLLVAAPRLRMALSP